KLIALVIAVNFSAGVARRLLHLLETKTLRLLHITVHGTAPVDGPPNADARRESNDASADDEEKRYQEETAHRWFHLLERFSLAVIYLTGLWGAGYLLGLEMVDQGVGYLLQLLSIV